MKESLKQATLVFQFAKIVKRRDANVLCSLMSVFGKVARDMDGVVGLFNDSSDDNKKDSDLRSIDQVIN